MLSGTMSICALAEGYQINTLSSRQLALGHTGVSQKLGSESMYFNPAGMAFMNKTLDLSAGITGIAATASAENDGKTYKTSNKMSTPLYVYAAFNVYDFLKAGVAFYTPYGSGINWGKDWPGALLSQKVDLKTYTIQPTLAWKITPKFSIGAGLTISWGTVNLDKALVSASSMDALLTATGNPYRYVDVTPASANLKGTSRIAVGYNVGVMYDFNEKLTVGASFRSKVGLKVESGDATVNYANELASTLLQNSAGLINEANFNAEMPMPYTITFGVTYRPIKKLEISGDAQFTGWSAYKELTIDFISEKLDAFDQHLEKNYHNAWAVRLGAKYALTERLDLRGGISLDLTPVNNKYYNPETPGMTKITPSLGFSFRPFPRFSVDVACAYVAGLGEKNASYTYTDIIYKNFPQLGKKPEQVFSAQYNVHAWTPSIGVGYSF